MPLIPLVIGGTALFGLGGTTGFILGFKTSDVAKYAALGVVIYYLAKKG